MGSGWEFLSDNCWFLLFNDGWMNQFLNYYLDQIALLHANKLDNSSQKPTIHNISSLGTTYKYLLKAGTMASKVRKIWLLSHTNCYVWAWLEVGSAGKKRTDFCLSRNCSRVYLAGCVPHFVFFFKDFGGILLGFGGFLLGSCWVWSGLAGGRPIFVFFSRFCWILLGLCGILLGLCGMCWGLLCVFCRSLLVALWCFAGAFLGFCWVICWSC